MIKLKVLWLLFYYDKFIWGIFVLGIEEKKKIKINFYIVVLWINIIDVFLVNYVKLIKFRVFVF